MRTRKDGTALIIGAIPPNLKLLPSNRKPLILQAFRQNYSYSEKFFKIFQKNACIFRQNVLLYVCGKE